MIENLADLKAAPIEERPDYDAVFAAIGSDLAMMRAQSEASGGSHADYVEAKRSAVILPFEARGMR